MCSLYRGIVPVEQQRVVMLQRQIVQSLPLSVACRARWRQANPASDEQVDALHNAAIASTVGQLYTHASTTSRLKTAPWVLWFNNDRTHGSIDDLNRIKVEHLDYARIEHVG